MSNVNYQFDTKQFFFLVGILIILPFLTGSPTLASEIVSFATGAIGVSILAHRVGLVSFGQGLFFGVGAYVTGLLARDLGAGALTSVIASILATGILALAVGFLVLRRRGVYFIMLTVALAQTGFFAMLAMSSVTGGENGLVGIPPISLPSVVVGGRTDYSVYAVIAVLMAVAFAAVLRINASPFGSIQIAIKENEGRTSALGYRTWYYVLATYGLAGGLAGLGGSMHTILLGFVPPNAIDFEMSVRLLVTALIGGLSSPIGALVGATFYVLASELLSNIWPRWMIAISILIIFIVLFAPKGLVGLIMSAYHTVFQRGQK